MIKRVIYLGLTFLTIFLIGWFPYSAILNDDSGITETILVTLGFGTLFAILYVLLTILGNVVAKEGFDKEYGGVGDVIPLFLGTGIISLSYKRIYFMDLGYFWCHWNYKDKHVTVYEQKLFVMEEKFWVRYNGNDIESLKDSIKKKLEETYKKEIQLKKEKKMKLDTFKNWNGDVDKRTQRHRRLNKLLEKE